MLSGLTVQSFLDQLASGSPAPGGGAVAGLAGALGAALVSMVGNLTTGRKKYAAVAADMQRIVTRAEALRQQLTGLIDGDVTAYEAVMAAYQQPKDTPEQAAARTAAVQEALKVATRVPLETLAACVAVIEICPEMIEKGNPNAISDGGAGLLAAQTGMRIAGLNVRINLEQIADGAFVAGVESEMRSLVERGEAARGQAWQLLGDRLALSGLYKGL